MTKRELGVNEGSGDPRFAKITLSCLDSYSNVREVLEMGQMKFGTFVEGGGRKTFESNVGYVLRFMIDHHVSHRMLRCWKRPDLICTLCRLSE